MRPNKLIFQFSFIWLLLTFHNSWSLPPVTISKGIFVTVEQCQGSVYSITVTVILPEDFQAGQNINIDVIRKSTNQTIWHDSETLTTLPVNNAYTRTYSFNGGSSGAGVYKVLASFPATSNARLENSSNIIINPQLDYATEYTAPICTRDLVSIEAQASACNPATQKYSVSATIRVQNLSGFSFYVILDPNGENPIEQRVEVPEYTGVFYDVTTVFANLTPDNQSHTIIALWSDASEVITTYSSPPPCIVNCYECISSFYPNPGYYYIISAWLKEGDNATDITSYRNGYLEVKFEGADSTTGPIHAKGEIIDGWQRIELLVKIPQATSAVNFLLKNGGEGTDVYFDDIRVHPLRSNMKSYVYDPVNLKLMAELDENNYATFYEYDHEGSLARVKKETERGVMTVKENRNNSARK